MLVGAFAYGMLAELALQRTPVHAEAACGFGDIAFAFGENALDVLPLQAAKR
jgi:hypothetical protein